MLDASVLVEFLRWSPVGQNVAGRLLSDGSNAHAPHLAAVEVLSAFRSLVVRADVSAERGRLAIDDLMNLPVTRHPAEPLLPRIWDLRGSLTAYDATYVALAEALDAPLLTADRRLARAGGHNAEIHLID
ncbi:MAG: type II toxin-antitoxin system VapC family toxin [Actinomycetota bacterium]|nr:type II toxin-antitoxin system VapC family toxin [Actinomycetota bacterium]